MKWMDRIGRRVKLRDLHIALVVAEAGSMTRAAEELAVSYPVVSKTISELEQTLGVKLFDRSISGVEPTPYGHALLKSGVAVFDEMRKGLQEIESIKTPDAGELRIGSSIVTDAGLLPAVIERFTKDFPHVVLHVLHEDIAVQQYENLRGRKAELVLGRLNEKSEPDLVTEPLFDEPLIVAAGNREPLGEAQKPDARRSHRRAVGIRVFGQSGAVPRRRGISSKRSGNSQCEGLDRIATSLSASDGNRRLARPHPRFDDAIRRQFSANQDLADRDIVSSFAGRDRDGQGSDTDAACSTIHRVHPQDSEGSVQMSAKSADLSAPPNIPSI